MIQRIVADTHPVEARELEQIGALLAERVQGRTLVDLRHLLESERNALRGEASVLMRRVWALGLGACTAESSEDLVIGTRVTLLDQPEFSDPDRIRGLFAALETNQRLLDLLRKIAETDEEEVGGRARDVARGRSSASPR